jgi:hypothetical protein
LNNLIDLRLQRPVLLGQVQHRNHAQPLSTPESLFHY